MTTIEPVAGVLTDRGTDITPLINQAAAREQCSARGLVALAIAESDLYERARRPTDPADDAAYWPDVSMGLLQQTVAYGCGYGLGDCSADPANIAAVEQALYVPETAIRVGSQQYGAYYRETGDHFEACARYNGGPNADWNSIPPENQANYARAWEASAQYLTEAPVSDGPPFPYNPTVPVQLQVQDWTCSIRSTMWALSSLGYPVDPATQQALMTPWPVDPALGLLDASGAGLAQFIRDTYGLPCSNISYATWADVGAVAGRYPIMLGGRGWNHWVAARYLHADGSLALANPAPGYMGIDQVLTQAQFEGSLGQFALVVIEWEADDVSNGDQAAYIAQLEAQVAALQQRVAELTNQVGYLTGDVCNQIQSSHDDMVRCHQSVAPNPDTSGFATAASAQMAAIETLRRGGA